MDDVFNWGKGESKDYQISIAEAAWDGEKHIAINLTGADDLNVDNTKKN